MLEEEVKENLACIKRRASSDHFVYIIIAFFQILSMITVKLIARLLIKFRVELGTKEFLFSIDESLDF